MASSTPSSSGAGAIPLITSPNLESFDNKMRDFRLAIEYKYLIKHAPGGVYMLPELDDIRRLHGVIFVRRGLWRNGVFRFHVLLPDDYNTTGSSPLVFFTPPIFNPLVHPETGRLDLTVDDALLTEWQHDKHFLHTIATAVKKIFYLKSYEPFPSEGIANAAAKAMHITSQAEFLSQCEATVAASLQEVSRFVSEGGEGERDGAAAASETLDPKCTLVFTEPRPSHEILLRQILEREAQMGATNGGPGCEGENASEQKKSAGAISGLEGDGAATTGASGGSHATGWVDETEDLEDGVDRKPQAYDE